MVLTSGLKVVKSPFRINMQSQSMFKNRYFPNLKRVTNQEVNQVVFGNRFMRDVKHGDEGQSMSDLDFKRMVCLFILFTPFLSSYYNMIYNYKGPH